MNNRVIIASLVAVASSGLPFALPTTLAASKGEQLLRNRINAESARVAELNAKLDPAQGIIHTLKKGANGNDVKLLQQFLKVYGVYPQGLVTGYFGPLTEVAVEKFQQNEGIEVVGIAGPRTRTRIKTISQKRIANLAAVPSATSAPALPSPLTTIANVVLTSDIANDGSASGTPSLFASTTRNIYAVLSLRNVPQEAEIAYIRYFQGNYVDSEVSHPSRSGLAYFHFQWSLKPGESRMPGNYSIVFYLNGKIANTVPYTVN